MAKKSKRKVETKGTSSLKYVSSNDNDASFFNGLNKKKSYQQAKKEIGSSRSTS
jgi:hypothetical protein